MHQAESKLCNDPASNTRPSARRENFLTREAAEVYLLLDFLSGRADRSMSATPDELGRTLLMEKAAKTTDPDGSTAEEIAARTRIEADLRDPTRLVLRAMAIRYPLNPESEQFEADAAFLLRARDLLSSRASPATGATIAFTWVVFRERLRRKAAAPSRFSHLAFWRRAASDGRSDPPVGSSPEVAAQFADDAFPNYRMASHDLARQVRRIVMCTLPLLLIVVALSAYAAWGKVLLDTIDAARKDFGAVEQSIENLESSRSPDMLVDKVTIAADRYTVHLCDRPKMLPGLAAKSGDPAMAIEQFESTAQYHLCDRLDDVNRRMEKGYGHLADWARLILFWEEPDIDEQWATAALSVLTNSILPVLYALLGSMAFVLRRFHDRLASSLLTPRDQRANIIRLALGSLIGVCIGLFFNNSAATSQAAGVLGMAVNLSASALAFLAGYGVEGVFRTLDALLSGIFKVSERETPPNGVKA